MIYTRRSLHTYTHTFSAYMYGHYYNIVCICEAISHARFASNRKTPLETIQHNNNFPLLIQFGKKKKRIHALHAFLIAARSFFSPRPQRPQLWSATYVPTRVRLLGNSLVFVGSFARSWQGHCCVPIRIVYIGSAADRFGRVGPETLNRTDYCAFWRTICAVADLLVTTCVPCDFSKGCLFRYSLLIKQLCSILEIRGF